MAIQYGFYVNSDICTGCKACMTACMDRNSLVDGQFIRKVYELGGGEYATDGDGAFTSTVFAYYVSLTCQQCDKPACVEGCPTGAMHKDEETGLVSVDTEVCIGCGACATACPYGAPKVNEELGHSTKCDGCAERLAAGLKPVCVLACPARALDFGPVEEISQLGDRADIMPFCSAEVTGPNLYVKPSADAKPAGDETCAIANPLEV